MIKTLRFQLTLWHTLIFGILTMIVFAIAYSVVSHQLLKSIDADLLSTANEFVEALDSKGFQGLSSEIDNEVAVHGSQMYFARFVNNEMQITTEKTNTQWEKSIPVSDLKTNKSQLRIYSLVSPDIDARVLSLPVSNQGWLQVGFSLKDYNAQVFKIEIVFVLALLAIVLLGILASWLQLGSVFQSVLEVRQAAKAISQGDLSQRVNFESKGLELSALGEDFNDMLSRIQQLLHEMREVSDHIAHDLRTPVSRIRGMAETSLINGHKTAEGSEIKHEYALATIVDESERLAEMINTMLEISQTDTGIISEHMEEINIVATLEQLCELYLPVAEDANVSLKWDNHQKIITILGNKIKLERAFVNLLDNAIKFSEPGSCVGISTKIENEKLVVTISDEGMGISSEDLPHVFERFFRSDSSRSKPGNGLGLSYAMSIIKSHGGQITVNSQFEQGSTFEVHLPLIS